MDLCVLVNNWKHKKKIYHMSQDSNMERAAPAWQHKNQKDFNMLDMKLTKLVLVGTNGSESNFARTEWERPELLLVKMKKT